MFQVFTGHLCLFNCIVNQGCVHVVSPGSITVFNCTFTSSFINLQGVGYSSITSSDFTPNRVAILIEEPLFQFPVRPSILPEHVGGWMAASNEKAFTEYYSSCIKGGCSKRNIQPEVSSKSVLPPSSTPVLIDSDYSDTEENNTTRTNDNKKKNRINSSSTNKDKEQDDSVLDSNTRTVLKTAQGVIINNVRISNGWGGITVCRMGQAWIENSSFHNLAYGIRCLHNSKCVILNNKIHSCETTGIFLREHSTGLVAGNQIFANGEAGRVFFLHLH